MSFLSRNYVGELQEMCQKNKMKTPDYQEASDGETFTFICKVEEMTSHGTGLTKKFAKQFAARNMLEKFDLEKVVLPNSLQNKNPNMSSVTKLIQYCDKERVNNRPLFTDLPNEGLVFSCQCLFQGFSAVGLGRSKKEAKENAAFIVADHFNIHKYWNDIIFKKQQLIENHPVQELNSFCQKNKIDGPKFSEEEIKVNNVMKYKIICFVGELRAESNLAHSKKSAKLEAVTLMCQYLKCNTPQASPVEMPNTPQASPLEMPNPSQASASPVEKQNPLQASPVEMPNPLKRVLPDFLLEELDFETKSSKKLNNDKDKLL